MNSTVNSMTISIVNDLSLSSLLQLVCVLVLIVFLAQKLLAAAINTRFAYSLNLALNTVIVPLLIGFVLIALMRVIELLQTM